MTTEVSAAATAQEEIDLANQLVDGADAITKAPTEQARQAGIIQLAILLSKANLTSKTVLFGLAVVAFSIIQFYLPRFEESLKDWYPLITGIIGTAVIVLRWLTSQSITERLATAQEAKAEKAALKAAQAE